MENISVLKSVPRNSGKVTVSTAAVECIAKLSQGLEMKWVRGEEDTPIDPKETPLQYVMIPGVELDSSGSMLYGMHIRWFGANDFGRFGCAVSFEGKVLDILYAWINETDSSMFLIVGRCNFELLAFTQMGHQANVHAWVRRQVGLWVPITY